MSLLYNKSASVFLVTECLPEVLGESDANKLLVLLGICFADLRKLEAIYSSSLSGDLVDLRFDGPPAKLLDFVADVL